MEVSVGDERRVVEAAEVLEHWNTELQGIIIVHYGRPRYFVVRAEVFDVLCVVHEAGEVGRYASPNALLAIHRTKWNEG